jgi:hypothetical protein
MAAGLALCQRELSRHNFVHLRPGGILPGSEVSALPGQGLPGAVGDAGLPVKTTGPHHFSDGTLVIAGSRGFRPELPAFQPSENLP